MLLTVYAQDRRDSDIYVMNADGTNLAPLRTGPTEDHDAQWSPDGSRIVFSSDYEIFVMDADGSNVRQLTDDPENTDDLPAWSPDGSEIAFRSNRDGGIRLYVMDADGSNVRRLTDDHPSTIAEDSPDWSDQGIVYVSHQPPVWQILHIGHLVEIERAPCWDP
jgi:Tol biopolymer transport system component